MFGLCVAAHAGDVYNANVKRLDKRIKCARSAHEDSSIYIYDLYSLYIYMYTCIYIYICMYVCVYNLHVHTCG